MNPSELNGLHILHVLSVIGLVASTFYACAGAPETRKKLLVWAGIAGVVSLLTGLRMWQGMYGFSGGWVWVKLVCWLGISILGGMAYRRRGRVKLWMILTLLLTLIALTMVYVRPF
jgi:hypothetical protein